MKEIKIVGVGRAGGNILNSTVKEIASNIEYILLTTDSLDKVKGFNDIVIKKIGEFVNGDDKKGARCAKEHEKVLKNVFQNTDVVVIIGGLGGGTASGAIPIVCQYIKELNIKMICILSRPFNVEGKIRNEFANLAIENIKKYCDNNIIIDNQKLLEYLNGKDIFESFEFANMTLAMIVEITTKYIIKNDNLNLNDIKNMLINRDVRFLHLF